MDPNAESNRKATGTEENNYLLPDAGYRLMKVKIELGWLKHKEQRQQLQTLGYIDHELTKTGISK